MHGNEVLSVPLRGAADSLDTDGQHNPFDDIRYTSFESRESNFGSIFPRRAADWSNPSTVWERIKEFSARRLAFDTDTLDAVAGIFGRYCSKTQDQNISFFCGLPIIPIQVDPGSLMFLASRCGPGSILGACSFQQLHPVPIGKHLCHSIPNGLDPSSGNDISNKLTYKLVYILLWFDNWELQISEGIPENLQRAQRSVFPSWSWAGWKKCLPLIEHEKAVRFHFIFDTCTTVHVEFEDKAGIVQRLEREAQNEEILNLTHQKGRIPMCLILKGTVFDITLKLTSRFALSTELGTWQYTWPPFLEGEEIFCEPLAVFDDNEHQGGNKNSSTGGKRNEEVRFLGLLLAMDAGEPSRHSFWIMMLRPVKGTMNGGADKCTKECI